MRPGTRAVSIPVDAAQSAYGMIEAGDYVDLILMQSPGDQPGDATRRVVAETILQNIRVVAVDGATTRSETPHNPSHHGLPKTVTLELTGQQAEMVIVGLQLGRLHLSLRSEEESLHATGDEAQHRLPTWAVDVSPALKEIVSSLPSSSTLESAVRRPPLPVCCDEVGAARRKRLEPIVSQPKTPDAACNRRSPRR